METSNQFKKGDVVRLKSGGPFLTAGSYQGDSAIWVYYFDNKNEQLRKEFVPESCLELALVPATFPAGKIYEWGFPPLPYHPLPYQPYVPNSGMLDGAPGIIAINASTQADGCSDPGDVHQ